MIELPWRGKYKGKMSKYRKTVKKLNEDILKQQVKVIKIKKGAEVEKSN